MYAMVDQSCYEDRFENIVVALKVLNSRKKRVFTATLDERKLRLVR